MNRKPRTRFSYLFLAPFCMSLLLSALSIQPASAGASDTNKDIIGMVTGSKSGTYIKVGQDIANVAKQYGVLIDVKDSEGSLQNILRMASKENAGFGIVQSDVLSYLRYSDDLKNNKLADRLRLIAPLYKEEVHIFAKKSIRTLKDLDGRRVAVGTEGGGSWLTAMTLFKYANIQPRIEYTTKGEAAQEILEGSLDAMIYVAGKPVNFFTQLGKLKSAYPDQFNNVHFVALDPRSFGSKLPYVKSTIGPADYSWLDEEIPTAAVKALLVDFDFSKRVNYYYAKRCRQLGIVGKALRDNLGQLQLRGHRKWQEVDLYSYVGNWLRDDCAWSGVVGTAPAHQSRQPDSRSSNDSCDQIKDLMRRNICKIEKGR